MKIQSEVKTLTKELIEEDDGGLALIVEDFMLYDHSDDKHVFLRLHSWDEDKEHKELTSFIGKKIRVTIEVIDDEVSNKEE